MLLFAPEVMLLERFFIGLVRYAPFLPGKTRSLCSPLGVIAIVASVVFCLNALLWKSLLVFAAQAALLVMLLREDLFHVDIRLACKRRGVSAKCSLCIKYLSEGAYHRVAGPSLVCKTGKIEYRVFSVLHRYDGPAFLDPEFGSVRYFLHGQEFSVDDFRDLTSGRTSAQISASVFNLKVGEEVRAHALRVVREILGEPSLASNLEAADQLV